LRLQGPNSLNRLLGQWWPLVWTRFHQKLLRECLVYVLEVLLGCQRIMDPRGTQTLERRRNKKKWSTLWRWKREVYIVKDMKAIAQNNELESQRLLEHHPFYRKDPYVEHPLMRHLWWRMMWMIKSQWNSQNFNSFWWGGILGWGVKIKQ